VLLVCLPLIVAGVAIIAATWNEVPVPRIAWLAVAQTPGAHELRTRRDGWVEVEVPASETDSFVSWILSFGDDARVFAPRSIRDQVVARLESLAAGSADG